MKALLIFLFIFTTINAQDSGKYNFVSNFEIQEAHLESGIIKILTKYPDYWLADENQPQFTFSRHKACVMGRTLCSDNRIEEDVICNVTMVRLDQQLDFNDNEPRSQVITLDYKKIFSGYQIGELNIIGGSDTVATVIFDVCKN